MTFNYLLHGVDQWFLFCFDNGSVNLACSVFSKAVIIYVLEYVRLLVSFLVGHMNRCTAVHYFECPLVGFWTSGAMCFLFYMPRLVVPNSDIHITHLKILAYHDFAC